MSSRQEIKGNGLLACLEQSDPKVLAATVFFVGLVINGAAAATSISPNHPDEVFQTLEIAHRLVFGRGFVWWEFEEGVRSYFVPLLLAIPYFLLDRLGVHDPYWLTVGVKWSLDISHAAGLVFVFLFLHKRLGVARGFLFALFVATFYYNAYISARTLTDTIVIPPLMVSVYLADRYQSEQAPRLVLFSGLAAGLCFAIRYQTVFFAAALLVALLIGQPRKREAVFGFLGGYLICVVLQGFLDLATWGSFLASFANYLTHHLVDKGVAVSGNASVMIYLETFYRHIPIFLSVPALTCLGYLLARSRRDWILVLPTVVFGGVHLLIPLKEVRFVFPFIYFLSVTLALGLGRLTLLDQTRLRRWTLPALLSLLAAGNFYGFTLFEDQWDRTIYYRRPSEVRVSIALGRLEGIKKAYVLGLPLLQSGGHAFFHADAEIEYVRASLELASEAFEKTLEAASPDIYVAVRKKEAHFFAKPLETMQLVTSTERWDVYHVEPGGGTLALPIDE